ncbi:MAG TPA: IS1634 family transposase [Cytophagales bacterium]|nr:IS1634 family transposase [Cytophagales bacterium]
MIEDYSSKDLDHLGIVSAMCDEINLVNTIDQLIPPDPRSTMTIGETVKLMVINGLGFTSRPLYLEAQFYASKPIERFLSRPCTFEEVSDDRLGRTLDTCFNYGCTSLFSRVASKAALKFNINNKFQHLDSTSMQAEGEYLSEDENPLITFGHSKDYRPDLKQFMISLVCSQDGDVALLAQTIAGNTSDKTHFKDTLNRLKDQIQASDQTNYFVADSELYTANGLKEISDTIKWITHVPEKIKSASEIISRITKEDMEELTRGYKCAEICSTYGSVRQRWLLIYSEQAYSREKKTLERQIKKEFDLKTKELKKLGSKSFECECDARASLDTLKKTFKYHRLGEMVVKQKRVKSSPGRPKKGVPMIVKYNVEASLERDEEKISVSLEKKGKFIIATNELDDKLLSNIDLLENYKGQQSVERGFRFLKDPLFMTSSVFLKTQERIVALGMIMCLCLLVYTLAQRYLRHKLKELNDTVPNQLGKPTSMPTMRWIFQIFEGVHLLIKRTKEGIHEIVLNINSVRRHILQVLGPPFQKLYANSA